MRFLGSGPGPIRVLAIYFSDFSPRIVVPFSRDSRGSPPRLVIVLGILGKKLRMVGSVAEDAAVLQELEVCNTFVFGCSILKHCVEPGCH